MQAGRLGVLRMMDVPIEPELMAEPDLFEIGYKQGLVDARKKIMAMLDDGTECGTWAVDVIEGRQ
jgi:hypothetical protein